jgi:hypothetical protein
MTLDAHRDTLKRARVIVDRIRGLRAQMQRDAAAIAGEKFTPAYQAEHKAKIREAAKRQAAEFSKGITADLAAARADRGNWSREGIIRRFTRFTTPIVTGDLLTADRQHTALLSDIRELLSANHWRETARELSLPELLATFEEQLPRRQFAACAVILREADRRAAGATAEGSADGQDARALPLRLRAVLNTADLPEFVASDAVFTQLAEVSGYLHDALDALDSDDDPGARRQQIAELQRSGASNDEIRAALAASAA